MYRLTGHAQQGHAGWLVMVFVRKLLRLFETSPSHTVIPAQAGIHTTARILDSRLRGNAP
jgi:hypothetical protein